MNNEQLRAELKEVYGALKKSHDEINKLSAERDKLLDQNDRLLGALGHTLTYGQPITVGEQWEHAKKVWLEVMVDKTAAARDCLVSKLNSQSGE